MNELIESTPMERLLAMTDDEIIEYVNSQLLLISGQNFLDFEPLDDLTILDAWQRRVNRETRRLNDFLNSFYSINTEPNLMVVQLGAFTLIIPL